MSLFTPDESSFSRLDGKVVVISGGATGIGAATARLLVEHGAIVVIGDVAVESAEALIADLDPSLISFVKCDVAKYDDVYTLFKTAHERHGQVHYAFSCAGIFERGAWFDPELTIETVGQSPDTLAVLDVNLIGTIYFTRVAVVFLRHGRKDGEDRSLTIMSSVNAWRDSPGLYMYQTSKHAVQGLMRSMRKTIYERDGVRVNCVCPGVTATPMTAGIVEKFRDAGLFWQSPESVARVVVGLQVAGDMNGKAIYVEGGEGWEIEDSIYQSQSQWLGEEATRRMRVNTEAVQKGALVKR